MTETDYFAAEYVLGLLSSEDVLTARARLAREPDFVAAVSFWETRLAPLIDEMGGAEPDESLWQRIEAELSGTGSTGDVVQFEGKVRFWQRAAAAAALVAVAALSLLLLQSRPVTPDPDTGMGNAPLMANIPITDTPLRLAVTYLPDRSEMLVSASGLTADGVHDHELWLVSPDGTPLTLGVVEPGVEKRVDLDSALAAAFADGSTILLSREPLGGAPDKSAPGPVVAEGNLKKT